MSAKKITKTFNDHKVTAIFTSRGPVFLPHEICKALGKEYNLELRKKIAEEDTGFIASNGKSVDFLTLFGVGVLLKELNPSQRFCQKIVDFKKFLLEDVMGDFYKKYEDIANA